MSDPHTLTITGESLGAFLWPTEPAQAKKASGELALWIRATVDYRVFERGLDAMLRPHRPYAEAYRKWKLRQRGGSFEGPEVNLQLRGAMRRQFRPKNVRVRSGMIGPTGTSRQYALFVHQLRPWIEMSTDEANRMSEVVVRIAERINSGSRRTGPGRGGRIV